MTIYYKQIPTLEMRIAAGSPIVIGTVGKAVRTQIDYYNGEPFVRTTYAVDVKEVLKGTVKQKIIRIEVTGGESGKVTNPQYAAVHEGALLVLLLASSGEDAFVPYFGSAFPLGQDGQITLGPQAAETLSSQVAPIKGESISLDVLRGLIKTIAEADAAKAKATEPALAKQMPSIQEMPQGYAGGGRSSTPKSVNS